MASKKWMEYQTMTTRAKKFGGAANYQAFLVSIGMLGGVGLLKSGEMLFNYITKRKENKKKAIELSEKIYEISTLPIEFENELGDAKDKITVGTKFIIGKIFEIAGEKSIFIEILDDDNNPYLLREDVLKKISNYSA